MRNRNYCNSCKNVNRRDVGRPSVPSIKNECGQCDRVEYPTLCKTFSACRADELCDADLKAYKASHNPAIGKRAAVQVCSACCEGNRCNQGGCQVLVKNELNHLEIKSFKTQNSRGFLIIRHQGIPEILDRSTDHIILQQPTPPEAPASTQKMHTAV
ncbi:Hypothetical predicted protein [Mytilus galloprovincialis]|uniref:Uncharacterized protein n=1 Tax=Mytilus galloprovincialis TaxID=29158 RepID=A0A8B6BSL6_MYTGA|nr:Hypothetical predicted protein [Mytilus galloprovincialis]